MLPRLSTPSSTVNAFRIFCAFIVASGSPMDCMTIKALGQDAENPVVTSIRNHPPRSPIEIARSILYLSRINQWKEIGVFVDRIPQIATDPAVSLAMVRAAGLETWLRLASRESPLSETQKSSIRSMLDRASEKITNDTALKNAIKDLSSTELVNKKRGALAIQAAGPAGVRALVESALLSEAALPSIASEVLQTLREDGRSAMKAALATNDPKAFARLLELAARIPSTDYLAELSTGIFVVDPKSKTYELIAKALSPSGETLPTEASLSRNLLSRLKAKVDDYRLAQGEQIPAPALYWLWRANEKRLDWNQGTQADQILSEAASLASMILRVPNANSVDASALATAVLLEQAYQESKLWKVETPLAFLNGYRAEQIATPEFLLNVLDVSKKEGLPGAELRTTQALGMMLGKGLQSQGSVIRALMRLSKEASPPTRYAAAEALQPVLESEISDSSAYGVANTFAEMMKLDSNPLALVIGGSADLRDTLSSQLSKLEIRSETARNAREAIQLIQTPSPYEMIFIVDRVADMSLSEFVQRLRAAPRTASLPIVMMASQWTVEQQQVTDSSGIQGLFNSTLTDNLGLTSAMLQDVQQASRSPRLDTTDRVILRSLVDANNENSSTSKANSNK